MKTVICVLMLFSTMTVFSQTVSYTYDDVGNRRERFVSIPCGSFRSSETAQAPSELETVTALPNLVAEKDILVYPNPTQGHFAVDISNIYHENLKGDAYLYDMKGKLMEKKSIHSHSVHKKLSFNLTHHAAGTYLLNLRIGENTFTWKIIKK